MRGKSQWLSAAVIVLAPDGRIVLRHQSEGAATAAIGALAELIQKVPA